MDEDVYNYLFNIPSDWSSRIIGKGHLSNEYQDYKHRRQGLI